MVDVVTYSSVNANPKERWMAYIVLPNGSLWLVRFVGETEQIAKDKAIRLWEAERAKVSAQPINDGFAAKAEWPKPADGRGSHFAGKAWLIHKETREKIRVPVEEVSKYLNEYDRGGPRSK